MKKTYKSPVMVEVKLENEAFLAGSGEGRMGVGADLTSGNYAAGSKGMDDDDWDEEDF